MIDFITFNTPGVSERRRGEAGVEEERLRPHRERQQEGSLRRGGGDGRGKRQVCRLKASRFTKIMTYLLCILNLSFFLYSFLIQ